MEGTLEEYRQLSDALEPILNNTRQRVINFEMTREELVKYSLAVERLTNQFLILRNYCNYYLAEIPPQQYQRFHLDITGTEHTQEFADLDDLNKVYVNE
jgi:hypothetical protein